MKTSKPFFCLLYCNLEWMRSQIMCMWHPSYHRSSYLKLLSEQRGTSCSPWHNKIKLWHLDVKESHIQRSSTKSICFTEGCNCVLLWRPSFFLWCLIISFMNTTLAQSICCLFETDQQHEILPITIYSPSRLSKPLWLFLPRLQKEILYFFSINNDCSCLI